MGIAYFVGLHLLFVLFVFHIVYYVVSIACRILNGEHWLLCVGY